MGGSPSIWKARLFAQPFAGTGAFSTGSGLAGRAIGAAVNAGRPGAKSPMGCIFASFASASRPAIIAGKCCFSVQRPDARNAREPLQPVEHDTQASSARPASSTAAHTAPEP